MSAGKLPIISPAGDSTHGCGSNTLTPAVPSDEAAVMASSEFSGNVLMVTLGCAKNLVDSEIMLGALQQRGFRPIAEPEQADLIVVNTCAFLQSAVEEGIDRILEMSEYKSSGRCRKLVVAGCMVERYRAQLAESLPEVDQFLSTDEILKVGEEGSTTEECFDSARRPYFLYDEAMPRLRSTKSHTAYLKVAEGCNRPCTFCIIPKIRGSFRSRPMESIWREAEALVDDGVKELNLVAQDLTAYGSDFPGNRGIVSVLPELLRGLGRLRREDRDFRVRMLYAYPIGVTEELLNVLRDEPALCRYLDLPLQHISHAVLKRMQRPLGERGTRSLIEHIRQTAPEVALRTTFIVGFPGETEEDVQALEQFVGEGHFTHVGVFTYSQEEEAKAFNFSDQVPEELKAERRDRIMRVQQAVVAERHERLIGTRMRVLVDGYHEETELLLSSRADWQAPETDGEVLINELDDAYDVEDPVELLEGLAGKFVEVEITGSAGYDLLGKLVKTC